jgi:hypothetical protein
MPGAALPGARESCAGDAFHVLWAVRRVLRLLDPASGLERVVMEDLTPVPPEGIDPELLLATDLSEFYGGCELKEANGIARDQPGPGTWDCSTLEVVEETGRRRALRSGSRRSATNAAYVVATAARALVSAPTAGQAA